MAQIQCCYVHRKHLFLPTHPVGVLGRHRVRPDVLHVRDEEVAVLCPADGGGVNVADDEAEEVAAVLAAPREDERPHVAAVKVFGAVEEDAGGLDGHRGHLEREEC